MAVRYGSFSNDDVDTLETLMEISNTQNFEYLWVQFVVGIADLSAFTVDFKVHPSSDYFTIASAAADYTTPEGPVLGASGDLTIAADGATIYWLKLDIQGILQIRIQAAGTSSTILGYWGAHNGPR